VLGDTIFHLALAQEWETALASHESYDRSTIGRSLQDVGFIHCSTADQLQGVADAFYIGRSDVRLLVIDASKLAGMIRWESSTDTSGLFPHIYGVLPLDAVISTHAVSLDGEGRLLLGHLLE